MSSLKRLFKQHTGPLLQKIGYRSGFMQTMATIRQLNGVIVLMYHSVADANEARWIEPNNHVPADIFRQQMEFLARERKVISLQEFISHVPTGHPADKGTVLITFDDGYLDNFVVAAPILTKLQLKATLFLPSGYIDRGETQWIDQIYCIFKYRSKHFLHWPIKENKNWNLSHKLEYNKAYKKICSSLISATSEERNYILKKITTQLQPTDIPPRLTMNWEEINQLISQHHCFTLGAHTLEHTDMTSLKSERISTELSGCAARIKEKTGSRPLYFSFPYGRTSKNLQRAVKQAGYKAAIGSGLDPVIDWNHDIFALSRVSVPATMHNFDLVTLAANTGNWRKMGT